MTNRANSAGARLGVKKPRLRTVELTFEGPDQGNNGVRPHGGYRGGRKYPPGQFSYNRDEEYQQDIEDEFRYLVDQEAYGANSSPVWLDDVHRETTHSGESPLFVNKLLATGKFEQEQGYIQFQRALLRSNHTKKRLSSAPPARNGPRQFYRPNRTHQYLSATDLNTIQAGEETLLKYGRPTRTTLLRARNRTGSAPVNAYDVRREACKRVEDLKNNSLFLEAKEFYNIYASDGETMHSFLTGARYNRAHLLDSRGLEVYGVYMPRENPAACFMTGTSRLRDHGDEIPSAPPDSPRSDIDSPPPEDVPRSPSSGPYTVRPASSHPASSRPITRPSSSRPTSSRRSTPRSRPQSGFVPLNSTTHSVRSVPRMGDGGKKELPEEITMPMPDHIVRGKGGVYVTLKGQKMLEAIESKLPRVTGVSLPKLNKSRDALEETQFVNQPPPTPVDMSLGSDRYKMDHYQAEQLQNYMDNVVIEEDTAATHQTDVIDKKPPRTPDNTYIRPEASDVNEPPPQIHDVEIVGPNTKRVPPPGTFGAVGAGKPRGAMMANDDTVVPDTVVGNAGRDTHIAVDADNSGTALVANTVSINVNSEEQIKSQVENNEQTDNRRTKVEDKVIFFMTEEGGAKSAQAPTTEIDTVVATANVINDNDQPIVQVSTQSYTHNEKPRVIPTIKIDVPTTDNMDDHGSEIPISSNNYPFTETEHQQTGDTK